MKLLWGIGIPYEIPSSVEGVTFVGGSQLIIAVELEDGAFKEIPITISRAKTDSKDAGNSR